LVENRQFQPTVLVFGAPMAVTPMEFRRDLWRQQTRVPGLSYGLVCV